MEINSGKNLILRQSSNKQDSDDNIITVKQPTFKGFGSGLLTGSGAVASNIENGGFLVSFLIQDFCGMTVPRSIAGFLRDKEVTGEYNIQEGFEVLGREGLTGPIMMAVAPLGLIAAAKFGKSTSVNSELIKRYGNSLKEMVNKPDFNEALLKDPNKFKQEFYRKNIEQILNDTLGKDNVSKEVIDEILKEINHYENIPEGTKLSKFRGKSKYRSQCLENISTKINEIKYSTGTDLEMLKKVKFGNTGLDNVKVFDTKNAIEGMMKYTDDAITANKNLELLNEKMAESIKNKALGKRILTTIGLISATLGVLSILPKIYARSNTAPGARKNNNIENNNNEINFKGKNSSALEKLGKVLDKNKSDFVSSQLEYNGHNFTDTLMAGLSIFGLLTPRCLRAYNRAEVDDDGKKDLTELWEIILRDITSSLAVIFAVPMLTRACVTSYENKSGFVLMHKDRNMSKLKESLDLLNPYSKAHVMTNSELSALYDNVNSKDKMLNFCKFIDKNNGDLEKIITKSDNYKLLFNDKTLDLDKLKGTNKKDKNKQIINFVENLDKQMKSINKPTDNKSMNEIITQVMKNTQAGSKNKITAFARGLNSIPAILTMTIISPYILGWVIPRLTYANTRRIHEKQDKEKALKNQNKLETNA